MIVGPGFSPPRAIYVLDQSCKNPPVPQRLKPHSILRSTARLPFGLAQDKKPCPCAARSAVIRRSVVLRGVKSYLRRAPPFDCAQGRDENQKPLKIKSERRGDGLALFFDNDGTKILRGLRPPEVRHFLARREPSSQSQMPQNFANIAKLCATKAKAKTRAKIPRSRNERGAPEKEKQIPWVRGPSFVPSVVGASRAGEPHRHAHKARLPSATPAQAGRLRAGGMRIQESL
jgi:hypothetical protein